ncbi:YjbH domain-containing protein, partial [Sulfuricurvum sp.]|uniref:YjbH domain-containing protein n=1 Tax=Sulfuricurvum sp. TaxID=2025608 RepID=UPI003BB6EFD2
IPFHDEGLYPHEPDPRWRAIAGTPERFERYDDRNLSLILADEIAVERYSNVQVAVNDTKVWASIENPKYNSPIKALGRVADILDETAPRRIDDFYIALKQSDLEYSVLNVSRHDIRKIKSDPQTQISEKTLSFSEDTEESYQQFSGEKEIYKTDTIGGKNFAWLFKPSLQTYLNDKDNPLTYKISLLGGGRYQTLPGGFMYGRLRFPIANTTDSVGLKTLEPASSATRTDSLKYIQYNGVQLQDLVYDQVVKLPWNFYGRGEIGYFEAAYGGMDVELYRPIAGGRYGIGVEYQTVQKRLVDDLFGFEDVRFQGKFINLFANLYPPLGIKAKAKVGEFFAGDRGIHLTFLREFKHFTMGAFITKTDTDVFQSESNRGYMDKGVFLSIPLSTIAPKKIRGSLSYSLKPWTRDVAQYASQLNSLVGLHPSNVFEMNENRDEFKE